MTHGNGAPSLYTAQQLQAWTNYYRTDEGGLFPARPLGWQGLRLRHRLKLAWLVFTGQCDALSWKEYR